MNRKLAGDHCRCGQCGEYFNSTFAFDMHRVGSYKKNTSRCLAPAEMRDMGMGVSNTGWWISQIRPWESDSDENQTTSITPLT